MTIDEYFTAIRPNVRIRNCLIRAGIHTMAEVCSMSEDQILSVRNLGRKSLAIVLEEQQKILTGERYASVHGELLG